MGGGGGGDGGGGGHKYRNPDIHPLKKSSKLHRKFQQLSRFHRLHSCDGRKGGRNNWNLEEEKMYFVRLIHLLLKIHQRNESLEINLTAAFLQFPTAFLHLFFLDKASCL